MRPLWGHLGTVWGILGPTRDFGSSLGPKIHDFESFWGPFRGPKLVSFCFLGGSFSGTVFGLFLNHFEVTLGSLSGIRWGQEGPRRAPRGASETSKSKKKCIYKNIKDLKFLKVFEVPRPSKTASKGPRRLPRCT